MTAVEWFAKEIISDIQHGDKDFVYWKLKTLLLEQALEMEKQQIIDAFEDGYGSGYRDNGKLGSEYFDETFKK